MAGWRVAETLDKTGGFSPQATRRRLLETAQHFHEVVRSLESIQPGGAGFISSVRVRLLHATVRRRILQIEHDHGNYYDLPAWGVPINDLHQLATVDVYSTALVYMSLPRQGVTLSRGEAADFLALWRWVGHVMGAPVDSLADPDGARRMFESVLVSEVDPSAKSAVLANNILTAQAGTPPLYASRGFLAAVAYRLNGEDMARRLRIDPPGVVDRALVVLQCWVLWVGSAVYPWLPRVLRERRDRVSRLFLLPLTPFTFSSLLFLALLFSLPFTRPGLPTFRPLANPSQRFIDNMKHYTMDKAAGGLGQPTKFPFKWRPAHGKTTPLAPYTSPKRTLHVSPAHLAVAGSVCLVVLGAVAAWLVHVLYPHAWHEVVVHKAPRFAVPSERVLRWRL